MARQKKCPECPKVGAPEYMLTYGDMMTLLLTFFVVLISFSSVEQNKFTMAISSMQGALGVLQGAKGQALPLTKMPLYSAGRGKADKKIEELMQELKENVSQTGNSDQMKMTKSKDGIHFTISEPMLFNPGSAVLKPVATEPIKLISEILKIVPFEVRVEGHSDNVPISQPDYASNWELSFSRALAVARKMNENGIDNIRFQVIGYGDNRPIADNSTETGRSINRRVEIYVNLQSEVRKSIVSNVGE